MAAIPAAVDALVTALTAAANQTGHALYGVQVLDGPPLTNIEPDIISVGYSPEGSAVEGEQAPAGLVAQSQSFAVNCLASAWRGDEAMKPVRDRAFEIFTAAAAEINRDTTLGGVVLNARPELIDLDQTQNESGATASVAFTVRVSAFA